MDNEKRVVIIVEDDEFLRSLAVTKLQNEGIKVDTASNGEEALEKIGNEPPHLILLDLMLPGMSGFDILQEVRNTEKLAAVKIIVFSNLGDDEDIKKAMDLGATEFLVKSSFTLDELVAKIKEYMVD